MLHHDPDPRNCIIHRKQQNGPNLNVQTYYLYRTIKNAQDIWGIIMLEFQEPIAGRYHLQQCLHHGGMSEVCLAYDELLQHEVAIKLVCDDQPESRQRLQSEIQTLSNLSHDHILTILDHGEYGAYHYLVMPYLKQGTLRERMAMGRLTEEEAGNILSMPWWSKPRHNFQKAIVSLALIALFITPLSLGFLVGRANAPLPQAERAPFAQSLQRPPHASTSQTTPTVNPSSGNTIPQQFTPTSPPHKHTHPHHKNGGGNGD